MERAIKILMVMIGIVANSAFGMLAYVAIVSDWPALDKIVGVMLCAISMLMTTVCVMMVLRCTE